MTAELRPARATDLGAVIAIERAAYPEDAWSEDAMASQLENPNTRYLVAEEGGVIVGYAGLLAPVGAETAEVHTVTVTETHRRRGIGRRMLAELLEAAAARGAAEVFLEVRIDNPAAQDLYRSLGFEAVGVRRKYYQPEGVDALVMRAPVPERGER
ncbi:ribosomal protein S18-alanine N-acetyltransferase [Lysobacter korlensis]|uniref:[Ribosomal protein bS18]-alanine N-acetyltransferase n=1 Tax=Lysobacter korlensis TaxID=553636 RepID=A0ABV6RUX2_9GAMM